MYILVRVIVLCLFGHMRTVARVQNQVCEV